MKPNRQYFLVKIDKEQQAQKRERIILGGYAYLGARHSDNPDYKGGGVLLSGVEKDSPAWKAALKAGDIIYEVGGRQVNSFEELAEAIATYRPGDAVSVTLKNSFSLNQTDRQQKTVVLGEKKIDLENPAQLRDMRHNLQFGEILDGGEEAFHNFPHAKVGDTLLFHHTVEYKARSEGDDFYNDVHLVGHDSQGHEHRLVHYHYETFGVLKLLPKAHIIPHPKWVFCHQQIQKASIQLDEKTGLWLPNQWEQSIEELATELEELKNQITEITSSSVMKKGHKTKEQIEQIRQINETVKLLNQQRARITKKMHQKKLVEVPVLYANKKSAEVLGYTLAPGDKVVCDFHSLYPLDIQGVCFSLARVGSIEGAIFQKQPPLKKIKKATTMSKLFNPLQDRIVVCSFSPEVISEGGLIIPDAAQHSPGKGRIVAAGPGTTEKPMQAKEGDVILFSKSAFTEIDYKGTNYLFMREDDILTTLTQEEAAEAVQENEKVLQKKKELEELQKQQVVAATQSGEPVQV